MSSSIGFWKNIPPGSSLEISINNKSSSFPSFTANARIHDEKGRESLFNNAQINPGPHSKKLSANLKYGARIKVKFHGDSQQTAEVVARVVKSDGTVHPGTDRKHNYVYKVSGKSGAEKRSTLILFPKKQTA